MGNFRQTQDFGISWGVPGLRIGKSQYGTWWVSVGLPFGFRITKNLGSFSKQVPSSLPATYQQPAISPAPSVPTQPQIQHLTENQKILEKMRKP